MSTEKDTIAIILDDVLAFHKQMEKNFVMDKGIHDMGLLESAVSTPFQTFGGQELYPSSAPPTAVDLPMNKTDAGHKSIQYLCDANVLLFHYKVAHDVSDFFRKGMCNLSTTAEIKN